MEQPWQLDDTDNGLCPKDHWPCDLIGSGTGLEEWRISPDMIADALEETADLLERDGWIQGAYANPQGQHCIVGAMSMVADETAKVRPHAFRYFLIEAVQHVIPPEQVRSTSTIVDWNDTQGRTKQEVLDTLRLAAKIERG